MKKKIIYLLACVFGLLSNNLNAQYDASPSFKTDYYDETRPFSTWQIKRSACDIVATTNREKKYAIVGLNYHGSTYCERYATFGIKDGASHSIEALSLEEFSWDHGGITKVLFDPRSSNVFYVLYQETFMHHGTGELYDPLDRRTYLKRFTYNGTSVLNETPRLEIFDYANGADFVISPNGRILVCAVNELGYIKGKKVQDMVITGSELTLADYGEAKVGAFLQGISMDIKGNKAVLGHTTGSNGYEEMRLLRFNFFSGTVIPISERFIDGHRMRVDNYTPKTVGIRENGDAFYLNWNFTYGSPSTYDLVKLEEGSTTPSYLFTESPSAEDLVISEDDNIYVSGIVSGEHIISLYNQFDAFEHMYDVHSDLDNPLHDIAVVDCNILASGNRVVSGHHQPFHQTFSCEECDGGNPHADFDFANSFGGTFGPTYYGMKFISGYCSKYDVIIDGSASSCENSYWLSVSEIDPATWALIGSPVVAWVGFTGEVPHDIQLSDYLPGWFNFDPSATYLLTLTVGLDGAGPFHSEHKLFTVSPYHCKSYSGEANQALTQNDNLKIYPNPSTGIFNVENPNTDGEASYIIKDINGRVIRKVFGSGSIQIDMEGNPSGMYFLHILDKDNETIKKLILK